MSDSDMHRFGYFLLHACRSVSCITIFFCSRLFGVMDKMEKNNLRCWHFFPQYPVRTFFNMNVMNTFSVKTRTTDKIHNCLKMSQNKRTSAIFSLGIEYPYRYFNFVEYGIFCSLFCSGQHLFSHFSIFSQWIKVMENSFTSGNMVIVSSLDTRITLLRILTTETAV